MKDEMKAFMRAKLAEPRTARTYRTDPPGTGRVIDRVHAYVNEDGGSSGACKHCGALVTEAGKRCAR